MKLNFAPKVNWRFARLIRSVIGLQLPALIFLTAAWPATGWASDHADPLILNPLRPPREREPRITDLHVFPDNPAHPRALVISLCVFPSLAPLRLTEPQTGVAESNAGAGPGPFVIPNLELDSYSYRIFIDLGAELAFDKRSDVDRYGATIVRPNDIAPDVILEYKLKNDASLDSVKITGLRMNGAEAVTQPPFQPGKINVTSGIFDDPFIFPRFFGTNVVGIVTSIPLDHFPPAQRNFLVWAVSRKNGRQIDHVGRSQRTQLPRFDHLNAIPPKDHVTDINRRHEDPTLMEDLMRTFLSPLFGRRPYDAVPDVLVYSLDRELKFPNGRALTDDVAGIVAQTGDTQLFEASYTDSSAYPRQTENDKQFLPDFPYLAAPWTTSMPPAARRGPSLTAASQRKLWVIGGLGGAAIVALLGFVFWAGYGAGRKAQPALDPQNTRQGTIEDDRKYKGSTFAEVRKAVFDKPYYNLWGAPGEKPLPVHRLTFSKVARGILPGGRPFGFFRAARRTLASQADLRWGPDQKGFERLLHPNGVCLAGTWMIDTASKYSGYFKEGSCGLVIARYSTCCTETRRGYWRSLSMVGKIYPTTDRSHTNPLVPASFITQEDLGGIRTNYINDAVLRNAPDVSPWRRGKGIFSFLITVITLAKADKEPAVRQLYEIAELGKPDGEPTVAPEYMRLTMEGNRRIEGDHLDFRDEILEHIYDRGNPVAQRKLIFRIEVTDEAQIIRGPIRRLKFTRWEQIGRIIFDEAVASYNGDFIIHFRHPPWRNNRNDPLSLDRPHPLD